MESESIATEIRLPSAKASGNDRLFLMSTADLF